MALIILSELIGSIPRPAKPIGALNASGNSPPDVEALYDDAIRNQAPEGFTVPFAAKRSNG
jgi:hypothetical protein